MLKVIAIIFLLPLISVAGFNARVTPDKKGPPIFQFNSDVESVDESAVIQAIQNRSSHDQKLVALKSITDKNLILCGHVHSQRDFCPALTYGMDQLSSCIGQVRPRLEDKHLWTQFHHIFTTLWEKNCNNIPMVEEPKIDSPRDRGRA